MIVKLLLLALVLPPDVAAQVADTVYCVATLAAFMPLGEVVGIDVQPQTIQGSKSVAIHW